MAVGAGLFSACAVRGPAPPTPSPSARVVWTGPPLKFAEDRCGPGSLAAVLNVLGDPVSEPELAAELPKMRGGVLSLDLVLAARRRGYEAALVTGDAAALRTEIVASRAAILMLRLRDLPGAQHDIYHYVVADGFDSGKGLFRIQFGDGKARWFPLRALESSWKPAGHALLRVSKPAPDLAATLRRGVDLEREGRSVEAAAAYRELLDAHPQSVRLRVNLGNAEAAAGRKAEAEEAYRSALVLAPADRDALNNLAWLLLGDANRLAEAEDLARRASDAPGAERAQALETLGRVLLARGRCEEAARTFETGLAEREAMAESSKTALAGGLDKARQCAP